LIDQFHYPRHGPGMMWERCQEILAGRGYPTELGMRVMRVRHRDGRVEGLTLRDRDGNEREEKGTHFISSMPVRELLHALDPPAPVEMLEAADRLHYRDFLTIVLIVDRADLFPDNWIYIHSPTVRLGRVQNFKNWSPDMVPDPTKSLIGLEYFAQAGDDLWDTSDEELIALGKRECAQIGLIDESEVIDGTVTRMPKAYPVYDGGYKEALAIIRQYLEQFSNLQLVGRNGQHRYNNQDHSMATAMLAARNIAGEHHDIWDVNVEEEYHEQLGEDSQQADGRLVPQRLPDQAVEQLIRSAFARFDPVALGAAVGAVIGAGLFLASAVLLVEGGDPLGPTLALLGNYLVGYEVSWPGAFIGLVEAALGGFAFGYLLAKAINKVVAWHEKALWRRVEMAKTLDKVHGLQA
jgi:hypothetical protein